MKGIYKYMDLKTGEVVYVGKDSHIDNKLEAKVKEKGLEWRCL